jgi:hypothetical protein
MKYKKQLKRHQEMMSISSSFGFARRARKVVETQVSTTQDRLQLNESHEAFLWLSQNYKKSSQKIWNLTQYLTNDSE